MRRSLEEHGFATIPQVLSRPEQLELIECLGAVSGAGRRGLLGVPAIAQLASSTRLLSLVRPHLPVEPRPVRSIYFDKSMEGNWLAPWHQDLTLAVKAKVDVSGFGPWSTKDGIPHVQPPVELLERMLTIRLQLDDCDATNGALRVVAGTHRFGRLSSTRIQELRESETEVLCAVATGDAMLMRPLLLHASNRSISPRHRRVLHIEYAAFTLPAGLEWHDAA